MKPEEIKQQAEKAFPFEKVESTNTLGKAYNYPQQHGFITGANFVNSKQPYTKEDMKKFIEWCGQRFYYSINRNVWCNWKGSDKKDYDFDQLLKMWEEQK